MAQWKVAVCECPPEMLPGSRAWDETCRAVAREAPDLLLLNEMPFGRWIAAGETFDQPAWSESCAVHELGEQRFGELGARAVASTRPRAVEGNRVNEGFLWSATGGTAAVHAKQFFPDEAGFYEARWFAGGERHFRLAPAGELRCGFLICTEVMFNEHARRYGREGAHLVLVPRAAGRGSLARWLVAMRMAAIVSGSYVLSSNRSGFDSRGQEFGGTGWVIDPTGEVVAQTSAATPVVFHRIDTELIARAQRDYPCYVKE
jgi:N-carbamoylputrescine amidase